MNTKIVRRLIGQLVAVAIIALCLSGVANATLTVNPSNAGNVFYTTQTVSIPVAASVGTSVDWAVIDYYGNILATGNTLVSGGTATVLPSTNSAIGHFTLALSEMTGSTVGSTRNTQFTVIKAPPTQTNSPYGAQTHFAADLPSATPTAIAPLLAQAGITQIRDEQYWENVENPKGTFTWPSTYTNYMSAASTNGLSPLITLDWANQFYDYSGGQFTGPTTTTGLAGFGNYSLNLLNKWGSQVTNVEVWDEYNGSFLSGPATANRPLYYYDLLQSVYTSIKPTHASVKVVGMATYPIADGFIKSVLSEGSGSTAGINYLDIFSVHPYRDEPEGVDLEFNQLTSLIESFNGGVAKPIWATEFSLGGGTTEEYFQETSNLARMVAEMQTAGVAKMFYYTVQDDTDTPYRGLVGAANASSGNYLANPVYSAYANTISQLYGWTPSGRITSGLAQTTYVYQFKSGTSNKYVCWGGSGFANAPTTLTMTIPTSTATMTDIMGNATTLTASSGLITVPIAGVDPVCVTIAGGSATAITEAANPVVADSVAGYSGTEGQGNWSYGTMSGAYSQSAFTNLPWQIWNSDEYRWNPSGGYPFMTIDQVQPWSGECTVRRWKSTVTGTVTISGTINGPGSGSTGVYCTIYVNGTQVYAPALITTGQVIEYSVPNISVSTGTVVDFVENTNGSPNFDATGWITRITETSGPLIAPSNLTAQGVASAAIQLNWTNNSSTATGAEIQSSWGGRAFTTAGTVGAGVTSYVFPNAAGNRLYTFQVCATGTGGTTSAFSNRASTVTGVPVGLNPPTNFVAQGLSGSKIQLNWTDNSSSVTGFSVQSSSGGSSFSTIATLAAGTTSLTVTSLVPGTLYTFQVCATGGGTTASAYSTQASASPSP